MRSIIYPRSGKIVFRKFSAAGVLSNNFIVNNGTVQTIAANVNIATTELADGNSDFPMGVYDTKKSGQLVVTMSSFQPELYAALMGSGVEMSAQDDLWAADQEIGIPGSSPYVVALTHAPKTGGTIILVDNEGSPFIKQASAPAEGQFSVSASDVEFNSANAGQVVFMTYEWVASNVNKLGIPTIGIRPVMQAIVSTEATDEDEVSVYDANVVVDKCKATGDINQPQQQREPQSWSFTLQVLKPRPGYNPVYWKYAERV